MRTVIPHDAHLIPNNASRVFKGVIYDVYHWPQTMFDGSTATFEMLRRPDTIVVLAVKDDTLAILHEEQPGRPPFYGIPGGRHDVESETELQAAQRELREETGLICKTWKLVHIEQPLSKIEWFIYTFVATDVVQAVAPQPDNGEKIDVMFLAYQEALQLADDTNTRFVPSTLLEDAGSLQGLLALPEYQGKAVGALKK